MRIAYWGTAYYFEPRTPMGPCFLLCHGLAATALHNVSKAAIQEVLQNRLVKVRIRLSDSTEFVGEIRHVSDALDTAFLTYRPSDDQRRTSRLTLPSDTRHRDPWIGPWHSTELPAALYGTVVAPNAELPLNGSEIVDVVQLHEEQGLGAYDGYSGAPVERSSAGSRAAGVIGMIVHELHDRATTGRAAPVLFAVPQLSLLVLVAHRLPQFVSSAARRRLQRAARQRRSGMSHLSALGFEDPSSWREIS